MTLLGVLAVSAVLGADPKPAPMSKVGDKLVETRVVYVPPKGPPVQRAGFCGTDAATKKQWCCTEFSCAEVTGTCVWAKCAPMPEMMPPEKLAPSPLAKDRTIPVKK